MSITEKQQLTVSNNRSVVLACCVAVSVSLLPIAPHELSRPTALDSKPRISTSVIFLEEQANFLLFIQKLT